MQATRCGVEVHSATATIERPRKDAQRLGLVVKERIKQ